MRSKCQKQLEQMTEQRDHWKAKASEYKLERDVQSDQLRIIGASGNEAYSIIKELRRTIEDLQAKLDNIIPPELFNRPLDEDHTRLKFINDLRKAGKWVEDSEALQDWGNSDDT
jgi:hypothetical protein